MSQVLTTECTYPNPQGQRKKVNLQENGKTPTRKTQGSGQNCGTGSKRIMVLKLSLGLVNLAQIREEMDSIGKFLRMICGF